LPLLQLLPCMVRRLLLLLLLLKWQQEVLLEEGCVSSHPEKLVVQQCCCRRPQDRVLVEALLHKLLERLHKVREGGGVRGLHGVLAAQDAFTKSAGQGLGLQGLNS
jgi:hypothetical protein